MGKAKRLTLVSVFWAIAVWANATTLVGTPYPTFVDPNNSASRYTQIVEAAFARMDATVDINVMRQAFVGSALRSQRADGHVAFIALDNQDSDLLYSQAYATISLHLASRSSAVKEVTSFTYIANERVATENRFANTDQLRPIDTVRWSRNPNTFDVFRQIADDRANYLFADILMIYEFNKLLVQAKRPPLHVSPQPLVTTTVHIAVRKTMENAQQLIDSFNSAINELREEGVLEQLMQGESIGTPASLLDAGEYKSMMRNW